MRKFFLLIMVSVVFLGAFAQNSAESLSIKKHIVGIDNQHKSKTILSKAVILSEDFETAALPTGWSQVDGECGWLFGSDGSSQYFSIPTHTNYAWVNDDECNGDMSDVQLITPSMDLTGMANVVLEFASFSSSDILTIKASTNGGTVWTDVTTVADNSQWTTVQVPLTDYEGAADVKLMFHYNDGGSWAYGWAIDDVTVYTLEAVEAGITNITPTTVLDGESAYPEVTIKNFGASTIDIFDITVVINDGTSDVYTSTLNVTAAGQLPTTSATYTMIDEWTTPAIGNYTTTATLSLTDDADPLNNTMTINTEVRVIGLGDVVAYFPTNAAGCPGIETDGTNIYTAYWASGDFDKYDMDGTYIETFTVAGASAIRDMAYDGQYFYGAAASTSLFQMDLANTSLISTITAPVAVRAIAYDDDNNTFWANNWDTDLTEFGIDGIATGNAFASPSIYGVAYDNWSDPMNPTMWLFIGTGDGGTETALVEYGLDGTATGRSIDVTAFPDFTATAGEGSGGLASYEEAGTAYLLVNVQQEPNMIYKVFLANTLPEEGPHAISYMPANNATNVAIDAIVSATFDVNITEVDFTGITITPNPGNLTASIVDDVLTIAHDDFDFNTTYTVLIPTGAISDGTDNLGYDVNWSFSTGLNPAACNDPSNIAISNISAFGATVNWTENGAGTEWFVNYGLVGFDPETGGTTVTANVTTLGLIELTHNTTYEVYVQANCAPVTSGWAGPVQFTTLYDCSGATITSLPYTTSFDTEEPCWVIDQTNANETWVWAAGEYTCLYDDVLGLQNEWLITPKFDFSAVTSNIAVSFTWLASYAYSVDPNNNYDMFLKVSTNGTDWVSLWDETQQGVFTDWTEYTTTVNASAYSGEASVWFAFNYYGTDGAQWSILDFTADIVSKSALNLESNISVYPNPANSIITIANAENENIVVLNMLGEVVANINNASSSQTIDISNLANGTYFVRVNSEVFKINVVK